MTENTGSYKKKFEIGESDELYHVMFHFGKRTIDGHEYTFETFFNSHNYDVHEVMCMPVNDRVAYLVWYTDKK